MLGHFAEGHPLRSSSHGLNMLRLSSGQTIKEQTEDLASVTEWEVWLLPSIFKTNQGYNAYLGLVEPNVTIWESAIEENSLHVALLFIYFLSEMKCFGPVTPKSSLISQHSFPEYPTGYKVKVKCDKGHVLKSVSLIGFTYIDWRSAD